ncbi:threonyl-tRNA synthetase [Puccinia sorghi]|uniref:Threonyl-tRNA synthetase n=1 Tax=Puccinia sorghi TaxID=27349 RepID=A0A0L6VCQ8_9BASI|nr:threonyl-tRNA synthetase [Puccinia sorghi]
MRRFSQLFSHHQAERKIWFPCVLPQGDPREAISWKTSPLEIARSLSKSLAERIVIAEVVFLIAISKKKRKEKWYRN